VKRLVCLLYAIGIVGCGYPRPNMPALTGTVDGINYYIDADTGIGLEEASDEVRFTLQAWGADPAKLRGLSILWTTKQFQCIDSHVSTGCYLNDLNPTIMLLMRTPSCLYQVPIAHEFWHALYAPNREPTEEEKKEILRIQFTVYAQMTFKYGACPPSDNTTPTTP
jgi:hypothetical protein